MIGAKNYKLCLRTGTHVIFTVHLLQGDIQSYVMGYYCEELCLYVFKSGSDSERVNVQFTLLQATNSQRGSRGIVLLFL
jgi:hypothetical protein